MCEKSPLILGLRGILRLEQNILASKGRFCGDGMAKFREHRGGKRKIHKELYREVKRTEKREKREYTDFFDRLTQSVSLTDDVVGEMISYLVGRHCMLIRNFTSVTEYTAGRIRVKNKQYELWVEGEFLRLQYFLPEELRIVGNIVSVSYRS